MTWQNSTKRYAKRQAKKYARKNKGFVVAIFLCLILGIAACFAAVFAIGMKDEFTLYNDGVAMKDATVQLESGNSYDLEAKENSAKVVVWGVDVSSYVKTTVKYINEELGEVETVEGFDKDGTYCIIYELDYKGDNFFAKIGKLKYDKVKLRKTVIIGGND